MPLLDLKTDLKSLKYGQDQPGGGSSEQPYIRTNINQADPGLTFDGGLIRGGFIGSSRASLNDTLRIGKFLTDLPKGPLWIVKQVGLQLSNPRLETRKGLAGVAAAASGDFGSLTNGLLQPTRIYNLGLNTLAQIPVNALGVHFNRHGILPVQDDNTKYLAVAQANNQNTSFVGAGLPSTSTNRLVQKAIDLLPKKSPLVNTPLNALQNFLSRLPFVSTFIKPQQQMVDEYTAGPGSVYGVGKTFIRRYVYSTPQDDVSLKLINKYLRQDKGTINYSGLLGVSSQYFGNTETVNPLADFNEALGFEAFAPTVVTPTVEFPTPNKNVIDYKQNTPAGANSTSNSPTLRKYSELKTRVDQQSTPTVFNYNDNKFTSLGTSESDTYNGVIQSYTNNPISYNNGIDKPITINGTWRNTNRETRVGSGRKDNINLTPIFSYSAGTVGDKLKIGDNTYGINDLVKFRIQALDGDNPTLANWMIFRAYLTQLSDNVDAQWNEIKYAGRGENFYIYNGFSRKMQVGFKVAALSEVEMKPMYQKLNYLMSNLMPDYKDNLIMRGPLVRMTIGNWIDGQTCVLNSLSYNIPQDSPWEIALSEPAGDGLLILPHIVEVNMSFTPIGSQTKGANLVSQKSNLVSNIAQNHNANEIQYITGSINTATPTS